MGSKFGPSLVNAFLAFRKKQLLKDCSIEFKELYYRLIVVDIFVLLKLTDHLLHFEIILTQSILIRSIHLNVNATTNYPFLDVEIFRENIKFKQLFTVNQPLRVFTLILIAF